MEDYNAGASGVKQEEKQNLVSGVWKKQNSESRIQNPEFRRKPVIHNP
jgi:hypothetical protein